MLDLIIISFKLTINVSSYLQEYIQYTVDHTYNTDYSRNPWSFVTYITLTWLILKFFSFLSCLVITSKLFHFYWTFFKASYEKLLSPQLELVMQYL